MTTEDQDPTQFLLTFFEVEMLSLVDVNINLRKNRNEDACVMIMG